MDAEELDRRYCETFRGEFAVPLAEPAELTELAERSEVSEVSEGEAGRGETTKVGEVSEPRANTTRLAAQPSKHSKQSKPTAQPTAVATLGSGLATDCVYLCGNSLGLQPHRVRAAVQRELDAWAASGVDAHFRHPAADAGGVPWKDVDEPVGPLLAALVGARPGEVAATGTLTANLNSLLVAYYRPKGTRTRIIVEQGAFPSDRYALANQCALHGLSPDDTLVQLAPRPGEVCLRTADVLAAIAAERGRLALVCLAGVQYYTGQLFDIQRITEAAHADPEVLVAWDLAHAVGNVELQLHDWGVDLACWCSYKYLNAGPGAIGGLFVHERLPPPVARLAGWWGSRADTRFAMLDAFDPIPGALGFRQSNPGVLDVVALRASLELFAEFGGMRRVRARSLLLTAFLVRRLRESPAYLGGYAAAEPGAAPAGRPGFRIITPVDRDEDHGAQVSILFEPDGVMERVAHYVHAKGLIVDERRPNAMRIAPAPLYNTFKDIDTAVKLIDEAMQSVAHRT